MTCLWKTRTTFVLLGFCFLSAVLAAASAEPAKVALTADRWQANGDIAFVPTEGFPEGLLTVKSGGAVLKGITFGDGTIEYDIKESTEGAGIPGIRFRQRVPDTDEQLYLRPSPNCPPSNDCVQYAPVTHGLLLWDVYPEYQASAPVRETGWNHVKLLISGRRMNVYVNGETTPSLEVGRLEGDALEGAIDLRGAATFANVTVIPGAVGGLSPVPVADPTDGDPKFIRNWLVSPAYPLETGRDPIFADLPESDSWQRVSAERRGLVNLSRLYGSPTMDSAGAVVWLKTTLKSDQVQEKHVSLGWARQIWIYVNGNLVFSDKNFYYPEAARRAPDGRLSLENGSFNLPLRKGTNEIAIVLSNIFPQGHSHYGWGLELHLDDLSGLKMSNDTDPRSDLH